MKVYTQGSFDVFHKGHVNLLKWCRKLAGSTGAVYVSILSDESYSKYRGHKPAFTYEERQAVVAAISGVTTAFKGDNEKTKNEINQCGADLVVLGSDWANKDIYTQYKMKPEELDTLLVYIPYTADISSTSVKERIKNV